MFIITIISRGSMCFNSFVYRKKTGFMLDFCQKLSFVIPESGKISPEQMFECLFWQDESGKLCVLFRLFCRSDFLWNQVFHRFNAALWKIRSLYGFKIRLLQRAFPKYCAKIGPKTKTEQLSLRPILSITADFLCRLSPRFYFTTYESVWKSSTIVSFY